MELKTLAVNTIIKINGKSYRVVRTPIDDEDALKFCDKRCAFYNNQLLCRKLIKQTGDCQPKYRTDKLPVYFELYESESSRKTIQT